MLKTIEIPGYGPFVFGRRRPSQRPLMFSSARLPKLLPANYGLERAFSAIRLAAQQAAIYGAEENILANDRFGCCTCSGAHHLAAVFSALKNRGAQFRVPTVADTLWLYSQVTDPHFVAATGANDNGADEQTVLEFWRTHGAYSDGSGKIASWSGVDATKPDDMRAALYDNKNLYLGIELPNGWLTPQPQQSGFVWDVADDPCPENGHCVVAYGYNDQGVLIDTWGMFGTITWAAMAKYCSGDSGELYTVVAA